jgi:hypothetical protein
VCGCGFCGEHHIYQQFRQVGRELCAHDSDSANLAFLGVGNKSILDCVTVGGIGGVYGVLLKDCTTSNRPKNR